MKKIVTLLVVTILGFASVQAQSVNEILNTYLKKIGGVENFKKIKGIKLTSEGIEVYYLVDGRQMTLINLQGKKIKQYVFDGETLWSHNLTTMKPQISSKAQAENFESGTSVFPNPIVDYKKKGYSVELVGKEIINDTEAFKIKLIKKSTKANKNKEEDIVHYFFDVDNFMLISVETEIKSGDLKGSVLEIIMSNYKEVDGLNFPFSITRRLNGRQVVSYTYSKIELNPTIDDASFKFPIEGE